MGASVIITVRKTRAGWAGIVAMRMGQTITEYKGRTWETRAEALRAAMALLHSKA